MQNLENMDFSEILIIQKLLKCQKDPFVRSALICLLALRIVEETLFCFQSVKFSKKFGLRSSKTIY